MWYNNPKLKDIQKWIEKQAIASPPFTFMITTDVLFAAEFTFEEIDEVLREYYNYFSSIVVHNDDTCFVRFYEPIKGKYNPYNDGVVDGDNPYNIVASRSTENLIVTWTKDDALRLVRAAISRYAHDEHYRKSWEHIPSNNEERPMYTYDQALRLAYMAITGVIPNGHYSDNECALWGSFRRLFADTKVGTLRDI